MDSKHQFKKKYKYTTELVNQTKQTPNKNIVLVHKLHSVLTSFKCKKSSYKLYSIIDIFWGILNALNTPYMTLSSQRKSLSRLSTMERKSYPSTKMQKN